MMKSCHKKGDVIEINIENTIISCIVIEGLRTFDNLLLGELILYDLEAMHENWFPFDSSELTKIEYYICEINERETRGRFKAAYRLLIGDKKVWFTYDCHDGHKKN